MAKRSGEIGGEDDDLVRDLHEVCERAVGVGLAVGVSLGADRAALATWVADQKLGGMLTEREYQYLSGRDTSAKTKREFSWQSERVTVLLWALGQIVELPSSAKQCDTHTLYDLLPPFGVESFEAFVNNSTLRSEDELFDLAVELQTRHAGERRKKDEPSYQHALTPSDLEVVQERHLAINWLTGYCGLDWDSVTSDT